MTTLAESFLADLDDLSDASDHEQDEQREEDDADEMAVDDIENLNYDSLEAVAHLRASDRYKEIMQRVKDALDGKEENDRVWTG